MVKIQTLNNLLAGIISSLNANISAIVYPKSFTRALSVVWTGQLKVAYLKLADVQKDMRYDTASLPALRRIGMIELGRLERPATQGTYVCSITGSAGAIITANTTYLSDPTALSPNYLFILDNDYTLTGSGDTITLRAVTPGSVSNLLVGDTLTCTRPLVNVDQQAVVGSIGVIASDAETTEEYRTAIGLHMHLTPEGGSVSDYILWGSDATGVARIYPYTPSGSPWQVNVYVESVLSSSGGSAPYYNYGIATSTQLTDVTNDIISDPDTGKARKPMGVILGPSNAGALTVIVYQVVITFTGTSGMSTADQDLITLALQQAVAKIRPFIGGAYSLASQNDTLSIYLPATGGRTTSPEKYVVQVIAMNAAPGAVFTGATMTVNGVSETSYTFDNGIIPFLKNKGVGVLFT